MCSDYMQMCYKIVFEAFSAKARAQKKKEKEQRQTRHKEERRQKEEKKREKNERKLVHTKALFSSIFSLLVKYTSLFKDDNVFFDLVGEIERGDDDTFYSSSSFSIVIAFEEARKRYSRKEEGEDEEGCLIVLVTFNEE